MSVQLWTYLMVGITFTLYIGIAIWSRAGSTKEFYVAGGGVSPLANGMATAADWMSAASFISMAGLISFMGFDGSVYLMGWTGGYVLTYVAGQMRGVGVVFSRFLEVDINTGVIIGMIIVLFYAVLGWFQRFLFLFK